MATNGRPPQRSLSVTSDFPSRNQWATITRLSCFDIWEEAHTKANRPGKPKTQNILTNIVQIKALGKFKRASEKQVWKP